MYLDAHIFSNLIWLLHWDWWKKQRKRSSKQSSFVYNNKGGWSWRGKWTLHRQTLLVIKGKRRERAFNRKLPKCEESEPRPDPQLQETAKEQVGSDEVCRETRPKGRKIKSEPERDCEKTVPQPKIRRMGWRVLKAGGELKSTLCFNKGSPLVLDFKLFIFGVCARPVIAPHSWNAMVRDHPVAPQAEVGPEAGPSFQRG